MYVTCTNGHGNKRFKTVPLYAYTFTSFSALLNTSVIELRELSYGFPLKGPLNSNTVSRAKPNISFQIAINRLLLQPVRQLLGLKTTTRPRTSSRTLPAGERKLFSRATALESTQDSGAPLQTQKTMPSGHSKPSHPLGRLTVFSSPPITRRQTQASVGARSRCQGALHLPESRPKTLRDAGSHDGAAILARPFYKRSSPAAGRAAHSPSFGGMVPRNSRDSPGMGGQAASPLQPTVVQAARGSAAARGGGRGDGRQQHGLPLLPSPTPHHFLTVAMARPPAASPQ